MDQKLFDAIVGNKLSRKWSSDASIIAETVSGATPTITPVDKHEYKCGTLTSLTITNPPAEGEWVIIFTSGSTTATTTTIPNTIKGLESFTAEKGKIYEINVKDNRAVCGKWDA